VKSTRHCLWTACGRERSESRTKRNGDADGHLLIKRDRPVQVEGSEERGADGVCTVNHGVWSLLPSIDNCRMGRAGARLRGIVQG
jgi:hypothetical protein